MMVFDSHIKIEENQDENEVVIRIDTQGTGRAMADALIQHAESMLKQNDDS
jgi:siroheme synthase (precorrin-2 oxidase/ferrochelatase)